jgi:hypothetical protein
MIHIVATYGNVRTTSIDVRDRRNEVVVNPDSDVRRTSVEAKEKKSQVIVLPNLYSISYVQGPQGPPGDPTNASDVPFDNSSTSLTSVNVQDALQEVDAVINDTINDVDLLGTSVDSLSSSQIVLSTELYTLSAEVGALSALTINTFGALDVNASVLSAENLVQTEQIVTLSAGVEALELFANQSVDELSVEVMYLSAVSDQHAQHISILEQSTTNASVELSGLFTDVEYISSSFDASVAFLSSEIQWNDSQIQSLQFVTSQLSGVTEQTITDVISISGSTQDLRADVSSLSSHLSITDGNVLALSVALTSLETSVSEISSVVDGLPASTGLFFGGVLSISTNPSKFDISAGKGVIADGNVSKVVTWDSLSAQSVTNIGSQISTNIAINASGNVVQQFAPFTHDQRRSLIVIGGVTHLNNTTIDSVFSFPYPANNPIASISDLTTALGAINVSGNVYSAASTDLSIARSAGEIFDFGHNWSNSQTSPNIVQLAEANPITFLLRAYGNGSAIFSGSSTVNPTLWDNHGTLQSVPSNRYTIQRIYVYPNSGTTVVVYGQVVYKTVADALNAIQEPTREWNELSTALLRGWLIVGGHETNLQNAYFVSASKFGDVGKSGSSNINTVNSVYNYGTLSANTTLSWSNGSYQELTLGSNIRLSFADVKVGTRYLKIVQGATPYNVTLDSTTIKTPQGTDYTVDMPDNPGSHVVLTLNAFDGVVADTYFGHVHSIDDVRDLQSKLTELKRSWINLVIGFNSEPILLSTSLSGEVYQYNYDASTTYYRFISNDNSIDAFYDSYTAPNVLGTVVATKKVVI